MFLSKNKMTTCSVVFVRGILELRGVCSGCGEAGSGLRGLDKLSWEGTAWNRERVRRRSPNCKLLGLCCFSGGI